MSAPMVYNAVLVHGKGPEPISIVDTGVKLGKYTNACGVLSVTHAFNHAVQSLEPLDAWSLQQMLVLARIHMGHDGELYSYGTMADDTVLQRCADLLSVDISLYCMSLTDMEYMYELTGVRQFRPSVGVARARLTLGHYPEHYVMIHDAGDGDFIAHPPIITYRPDLRVGSWIWIRAMECLREIRRPVQRRCTDGWSLLDAAIRERLMDEETMHHYEAAMTEPRNMYLTDAGHEQLLTEARRIAERVVRARYAQAP
jgi:hypothetical protein